MKKILTIMICAFGLITIQAQTKDELKTQKAERQAAADALQAEADALQAQIDAFPGWKFGAFGTVGANLSGFNNWFSRDVVNNNAGNIGVTINGYANLDRDKYFWRNTANVNLGWVKNDDRDDDNDSDDFDSSTDVFNLTSLYGYKLSDKWAVSTLAEYRTTIIDNFNDPGYLDVGLGLTWTPITDLVVTIQPLNYNFVFSSGDDVFESSLGAKIVADYTRQLPGGINFKTNLSALQSYKSSDLSNWTWINSFGYTLWKGIGVGFEFGLRQNKQEALNYELGQFDATAVPAQIEPTFDNVDNELQTYWLLGLNYSFK